MSASFRREFDGAPTVSLRRSRSGRRHGAGSDAVAGLHRRSARPASASRSRIPASTPGVPVPGASCVSRPSNQTSRPTTQWRRTSVQASSKHALKPRATTSCVNHAHAQLIQQHRASAWFLA